VEHVLGPYVALRGNPRFALLVTAHTLSAFIDWLYVVALFILAYDLTHSATVVALLTFTRLLPYGILLPLSGAITDRVSPRALMVTANIARAGAVAGLTFVHSAGELPLAFVLVFVATALSSLFRPALLASVPMTVPERQLIEANSVLGQIDMAAFGGGPAIASFILLTGTPQDALFIAAGGLVLSAVAASWVRLPHRSVAASPYSGMASIPEGLLFLFNQNERVLVGVALTWAGLTFFGGAYWTLSVVLAAHAFHIGEAGVGFINATYAVGGLLGGFLVASAISRLQPTRTFIVSAAASSVAEILFGLGSGIAPFLFFGLTGLADAVAKITATTTIQAGTPRHLLGRVFGAFESLFILAMAAGALVVGPMINALGPRAACAVIAGIGLVLLLGAFPFLIRLERVLGVRIFLYRVPILNLLPLELMDEIVGRLRLERYAPDAIIVRQGDVGDRMYLVKTGQVRVVQMRAGQEATLTLLARGDYFGEIALLEDVPRTATCRALGEVEVYALGREDFKELLARSEAFSEAVRAESIARTGAAPDLLRLHA
jgi:MFS family permease